MSDATPEYPLFDVRVLPAGPSSSASTSSSSKRRKRGGPVYQGVNKAIRHLEEAGTIDRIRHAGLSAQARSIAASIDRESGDDETRKQASGVSLAALHAQLLEVLERLDPRAESEDATDSAWREFEEEMRRGPEASPVQVQP